ncbi:DEAD/DEAH box helicase [archaeon]|nr:DEAD/DEAH box helicase [archaeon]
MEGSIKINKIIKFKMFNIKFQPRIYQQAILGSCIKGNTLIILPTGLGKTKSAILAMVHRLNNFPNSRALFLTVTKPLADQIAREIKESTDIKNVTLFTGEVSPSEREALVGISDIIVSTPQCIANDIINKRISLKGFSILILDEIQNCIGEYDYVFIAKRYAQEAEFPRIIGLTASPGSEIEKIEEICSNALIEDIELRTYEDQDVLPYIHKMDIQHIKVELPGEFKAIKENLKSAMLERAKKLKHLGFYSLYSKKDLLLAQKQIQARIAKGEREPLLWNAVSLIAELVKLGHALELLETQTVFALSNYLNKLQEEAQNTKVKATKRIVNDQRFKEAYGRVCLLAEAEKEHPKLCILKEIVEHSIKHNCQTIVFNNFRDSALRIMQEMNKIPAAKCKLFVGQAKKGETGLTQKKQAEILEQFRNKEFNVVVMTSVGELGLDIPAVDTVVFYEPVPSAIRKIQRMGRTARHAPGNVKILVTKDTRDEAYRWTAQRKEKNMKNILFDLKSKLKLKSKAPKTLFSYENMQSQQEAKKPKIYIDSREKGSGLAKHLVEIGMDVIVQRIDIGDFILSKDVGIERKTRQDFVNSIIEKRLLPQIKSLKENFEKPILIIEGNEDLYSIRAVHPSAIQGMLASIAVDFNIPILYTKDCHDTAELLKAIALREQEEKKNDFSSVKKRKPLTTKEQQEFIVESFPNIGPNVAKSLLKNLKSIKRIVNAEEKELKDVDGIGKKIADSLKKVFEEEYEGD